MSMYDCAVCSEKICEHALEEVDEIKKEIKELKLKLGRFKIYGTDECPKCKDEPGWHQGYEYERVTLFYMPTEHRLHNGKL